MQAQSLKQKNCTKSERKAIWVYNKTMICYKKNTHKDESKREKSHNELDDQVLIVKHSSTN